MRARDGMTFAGLVLAALFVAAYVLGGAYGRHQEKLYHQKRRRVF